MKLSVNDSIKKETMIQYILFIRQFIIQSMYNEFEKKFNEENYYHHTTYHLIKHTKNPKRVFWNKIFNTFYIPIQYYYLLCKNIINKYPEQYYNLKDFLLSIEDIEYSPILYGEQCFQEYVDTVINVEKINMVDYNEFINSMKNEDYRNKIKQKYEKNHEENIIKNYFAIVVINNIKYYRLSVTSCQPSELYLDMVPFYEYISPLKRIEIKNKDKELIYNDEDVSQNRFDYLEEITITEIEKYIL